MSTIKSRHIWILTALVMLFVTSARGKNSANGYDQLGNLQTITLSGNRTIRYVYAADGTHLRTVHTKRVGNAYVKDSTDYCGSLIMKNGQPSMYQFDGGYISFANSLLSDCHYYIQDYLGSNRMVVNKAGAVKQITHYYPYGGIIGGIDKSPSYQQYKFEGKELDRTYGLDWYDIQARQYDPVVPSWHTVDPLAEKYYWISPYAYCGNNPVMLVDPNGRRVRLAGSAELAMIQNTLPLDARQFVVLNSDGFINRQMLYSYSGTSLNFDNLKTLVESNIYTIDVRLDDYFEYASPEGKIGNEKMNYLGYDPQYDEKDTKGETINGLSTGESGFLGKTLFPDRDGLQNSTNGNIQVIVNKNLSPAGAAEVYCHEGNGHALLYVQNGGNHKGASHQPIDGKLIDGNKRLVEMIIESKKETIQNMQTR